jgi:dsDNA-specific endonuclease/ATPase MutS2
MVETGDEKGYKALAHLARNKYGHDKTGPQSVTNIQNNIGQLTVTNKEEYERMALEVKDQIIDLNIIDAEMFKIEHKDE